MGLEEVERTLKSLDYADVWHTSAIAAHNKAG
jgi:hypothetical protein